MIRRDPQLIKESIFVISRKRYAIVLLMAVLMISTYLTLPKVDSVEPSLFFYAKHLTPLYFLLVVASIIGAILSKSRPIRVFCTITFVLALHLTPSILLTNPWHFDSYAFLAEAVYVERNGYIADVQHWSLFESPAIGLIYGPFLLVTGIDPFVFLKIYQGLLSTVLALLIYSIAEKFTSNEKNAVFAPISTMAIIWVNEFFLNRQSISLIFYLSSWLLLSHLTLKRFERRVLLLLGTQILMMVASHPATPLFFVANLLFTVVFSKLFKTFESYAARMTAAVFWFSTFVWLLWNYLVSHSRSLVIFSNIIDALIAWFARVPTAPGTSRATILSGFTLDYMFINYFKLACLVIVAGLGLLAPLLIYWRNRRSNVAKTSIMLMAWILSNSASAIPLLASGLPYFERPGLFMFIAWGPMAALIYENLRKKDSIKWWKAIRFIFIASLLVIPSLLIPVTKYAPLPYLYPTNREIEVMKFSTALYSEDYPLILLEYTHIYTYNYLAEIRTSLSRPIQRLSDVFEQADGLSKIAGSRSFVVIYRLITRDGFRVTVPSMYQLVANVTTTLPELTHNKVYDSGWPYSLLVPARR